MIALYAIWCGFCWVLRGGKFGAIVRGAGLPEPGTTVTRIVCALLMVAPLAPALGQWSLALWASVYAAMTIGYFRESMGLEKPADIYWLSAWGFVVGFVACLPLVTPWGIFGALAGFAYLVNKPFGRRFGTDWTERAEFLTGCILGAALFLST